MRGHCKVPLKDVEEIKDFIQKHTQTEISEAWNISYGYVSLLCKKYGIKAKREKCRKPIVDIEQLKEYGKNHTITECSRHFNVSPNLISSYKKRFKSEIEILQKQKSKLIDMVKQLMSYELPNTDIGYTYQQDCFKAAKKLLEELK